MFIVLEGPDASGKSTQLDLLEGALLARGVHVVATREPGGTEVGAELRRLLLQPGGAMRPLTELLLMVADRHEHVEEIIRPALCDGHWVLCSRYALSSLAYQGAGRGLSEELVGRLNELATGGLQPDFTFLLDLPPAVALERTRERDRFEGEGLAFFTQVRASYLRLIRSVQQGCVIDATRPPAEVCREILARLPLAGYHAGQGGSHADHLCP